MHGYTFYQCDWTGFPMRATNCYMPVWTDGKMVKRGSYCNWESVVAHAQYLYDNNESSAAQHAHVLEYVNELTGMTMDSKSDFAGFNFRHLEHFKDESKDEKKNIPFTNTSTTLFGNNWDMSMYHKVCCAVTAYHELSAVKITPTGAYEVLVGSNGGKFRFDEYLERPYMNNPHGLTEEVEGCKFQSFLCTHKPKMAKDREVSVFYWPFKNGLAKNDTASSLFKMQIYGDVLLVQQTKESCFKERDRYVHFTKQQFEEYFSKKRKKPTDSAPALSDAEFKTAKAQMVASLDEFERKSSQAAVTPGALLGGATMPPSTGKQLKEVAEHLELPPLARQRTFLREHGGAQEAIRV